MTKSKDLRVKVLSCSLSGLWELAQQAHVWTGKIVRVQSPGENVLVIENGTDDDLVPFINRGILLERV
jgi:hypothetical protein